MKTGKLEATRVWKGGLGWCVSHRNSMLSLAFILHIMGNCNGLKLGHLRPQCLHFRRTGNLGVIAGWPGREEGSNCEKGVEISQRNYWHSPGELRWRPKPEQRNKLQMMLWISSHYTLLTSQRQILVPERKQGMRKKENMVLRFLPWQLHIVWCYLYTIITHT